MTTSSRRNEPLASGSSAHSVLTQPPRANEVGLLIVARDFLFGHTAYKSLR
jgi:hypothetical protein